MTTYIVFNLLINFIIEIIGMESKKHKRIIDEVEEEVGDFENCMSNIREYAEDLLNLIGHSSTKVNNTNQEKIKRMVMDIIEQAIIQSNAINSLVRRVIEQCELTSVLLEKRDEVFTYADATKKQVRKRSVSRKREEMVVTLIYPKTEMESDLTKGTVNKNINPIDLGVGIKRVKKISKVDVLMEVNSIKDFEKLELEVNTNESLRENFTIRKGVKLKPKILFMV